MIFKLSNLNSNLALTLGYLNPALNNSAQTFTWRPASNTVLHRDGSQLSECLKQAIFTRIQFFELYINRRQTNRCSESNVWHFASQRDHWASTTTTSKSPMIQLINQSISQRLFWLLTFYWVKFGFLDSKKWQYLGNNKWTNDSSPVTEFRIPFVIDLWYELYENRYQILWGSVVWRLICPIPGLKFNMFLFLLFKSFFLDNFLYSI